MLIVLILGEIMMRVMIINDTKMNLALRVKTKVQFDIMSFHYWLVIFSQFQYRL
ncbi:hypothetical protein Golax_010101 [Gossypium laxum]|uniref:Uncharacterized protein n=1 Tax=Gossypium laxum TaxID=34288 RepID=A0A7J8ZHM8_9ROSI|nr:hypothetical protein [Gossypium laxum]